MTKQEKDELFKNNISEEDFIKWLDNVRQKPFKIIKSVSLKLNELY